jgi:hypothetical protein
MFFFCPPERPSRGGHAGVWRMSVLAGRSGHGLRYLCQGASTPKRNCVGRAAKRTVKLESAGSRWLRSLRYGSSRGAVQSSPTAPLWKLFSSALRRSLLRLCADHPHGQQDRQRRGGECPRRITVLFAFALSRRRACAPQCQSYRSHFAKLRYVGPAILPRPLVL